MAVETDIERAIFVSADDFGVTATYTPTGGEAVSISGIFDNDYQEVDAGGGVGFAVRQPRFHTPTANVASAAEGDSLVVNGTTYVIRVVMDDGTGMTMLAIEEQ